MIDDPRLAGRVRPAPLAAREYWRVPASTCFAMRDPALGSLSPEASCPRRRSSWRSSAADAASRRLDGLGSVGIPDPTPRSLPLRLTSRSIAWTSIAISHLAPRPASWCPPPRHPSPRARRARRRGRPPGCDRTLQAPSSSCCASFRLGRRVAPRRARPGGRHGCHRPEPRHRRAGREVAPQSARGDVVLAAANMATCGSTPAARRPASSSTRTSPASIRALLSSLFDLRRFTGRGTGYRRHGRAGPDVDAWHCAARPATAGGRRTARSRAATCGIEIRRARALLRREAPFARPAGTPRTAFTRPQANGRPVTASERRLRDGPQSCVSQAGAASAFADQSLD